MIWKSVNRPWLNETPSSSIFNAPAKIHPPYEPSMPLGGPYSNKFTASLLLVEIRVEQGCCFPEEAGSRGEPGSVPRIPADLQSARLETGARPPWLGALIGFSSSQQHQINMEQGIGGKIWNKRLEGLPVLLPSSPGGGILSGISAAGSSPAPAGCTELQGPGDRRRADVSLPAPF